MGEAKRRKEKDPFYGCLPKAGKGIVVSHPLKIEAGVLTMDDAKIDTFELRRAILFWDRIAYPQNNGIVFDVPDADRDYLEEEGILTRPMSNLQVGGNLSEFYAKCHLKEFEDLESKEPGQWCLSEGTDSFIYSQPHFKNTRAPLVELYRAIPLPDADVPIADLLEFKHHRLDEVKHLVVTIDRFYSDLLKAEDQVYEIQRLVGEIEFRCTDLIKVARESGLKFRQSDIGISFSGDVVVGDVLKGALVGGVFEMPELGALVGGVLSRIKIKTGLGFSLGKSENSELKTSPYRFVASIHNEPI